MLIIEHLVKEKIFSSLTNSELDLLEKTAEVSHFSEDEVFIEEGKKDDSMYIVLSGEVEIYKEQLEEGQLHDYFVQKMVAGNIFGEISFLNGAPRTCSAKAKNDTTTLKISRKNLEKVARKSKNGKSLIKKLDRNIAEIVANRLNTSNDTYTSIMHDNLEMLTEKNIFAKFFITILIIMSIAMLITRVGVEFLPKQYLFSNFFNLSYALLIFIPAAYFVKHYDIYPKSIGIRRDNLLRGILVGLYVGTIMTFLMLFTIWIVDHSHNVANVTNLLLNKVLHQKLDITWIGLYIVSVILQEFIVRGCMQSSLHRFFHDKKQHSSILISNMLFSLAHSHLGITAIMVTFVLGLIWGCSYAKTRNLATPIVAHMIVGIIFLNANIL